MKMVLISSFVAILIAFGAFSILQNAGTDSASVYSSENVRQ
ncbi:MAG: hypothetical protein VW665_10865 [Candidatus Puniceispirillum sp.]|jgi:hypothetical protein